ncbi:uncharacterized protein LOC134208856 [Armigeres subalbatus]|uniref:uncharacterized protein LOC134208856 n=1 Tax=Armigeres subalbatus TaxID=124917 RepID=UPI002ED03E87
MFSSSGLEISMLLCGVEIPSHSLCKLKVERFFLQILNRRIPVMAPSVSPWLIFAINEMIFIGTLELIEVELALKYDIGLGSGGLPLDVSLRPSTHSNHCNELTFTVSDSSDVEILPVRECTIIDLTVGYPEILTRKQRKRKLKRISKAEKRQRREQRALSTDDDEQPEFWIDVMETDENENYNCATLQIDGSKFPSNFSDHWVLSDHDPPVTNLRIGIFCPRPYRTRLMNAIMNIMDQLPLEEPHPQYKRNGFYLDTLWFLAANSYSASWMISKVEKLSKLKIWRQARIIVEPWSDRFIVKNVLQLVLPWKNYRGNRKTRVIQRLRKANLMHGSNLWNLIGCKMAKFKIQVTLAVNEETIESLKRTQFYVFYGFSQYRCKVIKTALK